MHPVGGRRGEHDLAVAGHLDLARLVAVVGQRDPPHLGGILGNDGDLGARLDVAVGPVKGHPVGREQRAIPVRRAHRPAGGRPTRSGPVPDVLHVAELAGVVARPVRPPAGHRQVLVPAVARRRNGSP